MCHGLSPFPSPCLIFTLNQTLLSDGMESTHTHSTGGYLACPQVLVIMDTTVPDLLRTVKKHWFLWGSGGSLRSRSGYGTLEMSHVVMQQRGPRIPQELFQASLPSPNRQDMTRPSLGRRLRTPPPPPRSWLWLMCIFQGEPLWSLYVALTECIPRECSSQRRGNKEGIKPAILSLHLCTPEHPKGQLSSATSSPTGLAISPHCCLGETGGLPMSA